MDALDQFGKIWMQRWLLGGRCLAFDSSALKGIGILSGSILLFTYITWPALVNQITPISDFAADMLLANRLLDEGYLLVGHYSRWRFNHPGPFWFYYNHLVEWGCGRLFPSRFQVWHFGSVLINSAFVSFSSAALSQYFLNRVSLRYCTAFVLLLVVFVGNEITNLWMPNRLITPYLGFLTSVLHVMNGKFWYMSYATLFCCILVHGYVTMPILTLPLLTGALLIGWVQNRHRDGVLRENSVTFLLSVLIALLFLLPIVIDFVFSNPSNVLKIIEVISSLDQVQKPAWSDVFNFTIDLLFKANPIGWAFLIILLILTGTRGFFKIEGPLKKRLFLVCILISSVVLTTLFCYKNTPAPVFPFSARYLVAVPPILFAMALVPVFSSSPSYWDPKMNLLLVFLAIFFFFSLSFSISLSIAPKFDLGPLVVRFADKIESTMEKNGKVALNYSEHEQWPLISGLILELDKRGFDVCTVWKHMEFLFTRKHICALGRVPDFMVIKSSYCGPECLLIEEDFGLKKFKPE